MLKINGVEVDQFTYGYLTCALWSSVDDDGSPLDAEHEINDFDRDTIRKAAAECGAFTLANAADLNAYCDGYYERRGRADDSMGEQCAGHDFWLSRCGHGAGFFDRTDVDEGVRDRLQAAAERAGDRDVYEGDDCRLHISPG